MLGKQNAVGSKPSDSNTLMGKLRTDLELRVGTRQPGRQPVPTGRRTWFGNQLPPCPSFFTERGVKTHLETSPFACPGLNLTCVPWDSRTSKVTGGAGGFSLLVPRRPPCMRLIGLLSASMSRVLGCLQCQPRPPGGIARASPDPA